MEGTLVFELDLGTTQSMLKNTGLDDGGRAQQQLDESFLKYCDDYVPVKNRVLLGSGRNSTTIGSGEIVWNTPYARYQYFGELMVDPETGKGAFFSPTYTGENRDGFWSRKGVQKVRSGRKLKYHGGGRRGRMWGERAWADHQDEIIAEVQSVVDKGVR